MKDKKVIVFDLDDTLIKEIDFLKSAYLEIAHYLDGGKELYNKMIYDYYDGANVFKGLVKSYNTSIDLLLNMYRNHIPKKLPISTQVKTMLTRFKEKGAILGIITDGRSITQRNKLIATELNDFFDLIIISEEFGSEKPNKRNYQAFHTSNADNYYYIGDNIKKDFITPNQLEWITIGILDAGDNVHKQDMTMSKEYHPHYFVKDILDIETKIY